MRSSGWMFAGKGRPRRIERERQRIDSGRGAHGRRVSAGLTGPSGNGAPTRPATNGSAFRNKLAPSYRAVSSISHFLTAIARDPESACARSRVRLARGGKSPSARWSRCRCARYRVHAPRGLLAATILPMHDITTLSDCALSLSLPIEIHQKHR